MQPGDETGLAPTQLGEAPVTEAHTAWALDPDVPEPELRGRWPVVIAVVVASLVIIGAAAGVAAWQLREPPSRAEEEPAALTVPPASPADSPPDVVITPSAEPTGLPTPTGLAAYDARFLEKLAASGWYITDPSMMTQRAHQMCAEFDLGTTPERIYQKFIGLGMSTQEAVEFMNLVTQTYPGCG